MIHTIYRMDPIWTIVFIALSDLLSLVRATTVTTVIAGVETITIVAIVETHVDIVPVII